mgnify:CR=1 FL=1
MHVIIARCSIPQEFHIVGLSRDRLFELLDSFIVVLLPMIAAAQTIENGRVVLSVKIFTFLEA